MPSNDQSLLGLVNAGVTRNQCVSSGSEQAAQNVVMEYLLTREMLPFAPRRLQ